LRFNVVLEFHGFTVMFLCLFFGVIFFNCKNLLDSRLSTIQGELTKTNTIQALIQKIEEY
jgi:hypothetical protein